MPFDIPILHRDDDIVVVDKPHFLATMPRGGHVAQTALVRLRRELDLPELEPRAPAGPADGGGAAVHGAPRGARRVSDAVRAGRVRKTYLARAAVDPDLELPLTVRSRIVKRARPVTGVGGAGRAERRDAGRAPRRWAVPADAAHRAHPPAARAHGLAGPADHRGPVVPRGHRRGRRRLLAPAATAGAHPRVRRPDQRASARVRQQTDVGRQRRSGGPAPAAITARLRSATVGRSSSPATGRSS